MDNLVEKYKHSKNISDYQYVEDRYFKDYPTTNLYDKKYAKINEFYASELSIYELTNNNRLLFSLKNKEDSYKLVEYILDFITSNNECFFLKKNNIILNDYQKELLNIKNLTIENANIDRKMIDIISRFFPKLKELIMINCDIKKDSILSNMNCNIEIYNSYIENIISLNNFKNKLIIYNTDIDKIMKCNIDSKELIISMEDNLLEQIFMLCSFNSLRKLNIDIYIANKCLLFMPYSCPNLNILEIDGKVSSYDFLYHFKELCKCDINSIELSIYSENIDCPDITDKEYKKRIIFKHKNDYNHDKLISNMPISERKEASRVFNSINEKLALKTELIRIMEILNIVKYSSYNRNINGKVDFYYSYDSFNNLISYNHSILEEDIKYIIDNKLYSFSKKIIEKNIKTKEKIILVTPFIYNISGYPLVFSNNGYTEEQHINHFKKYYN